MKLCSSTSERLQRNVVPCSTSHKELPSDCSFHLRSVVEFDQWMMSPQHCALARTKSASTQLRFAALSFLLKAPKNSDPNASSSVSTLNVKAIAGAFTRTAAEIEPTWMQSNGRLKQ